MVIYRSFISLQIAMYLRENQQLIENHKSLVKVMELLVESNIKSSEMHEVLAMKMHYLAFLLKNMRALVRGTRRQRRN